MTRKQAASRAIAILSKDEENREICEALQKIVSGRLTEDWNKELVLESIEDFIYENGYYPSSKEMDQNPNMPCHASAYMAMGMGYTKVKKTYFPDVIDKKEWETPTQEEWIQQFIEIYGGMDYKPCIKEFDRDYGSKYGWANTWMARTGSRTWRELLTKAGFEDCVRNVRTPHYELEVTLSESDLPCEEYDKMEAILRPLLN